MYFYADFSVADLYRQLNCLHSSYVLSNASSLLTCYHAQLIATKELEKIKSSVNQYKLINTFFSKSRSSSIATNFFIGGGLQHDAVCVLFEIQIDTIIQTKPFAPIHNCRVNSDEGEVLFTMGTIFKIESCNQYDYFWHIKLVLCIEHDQALKDLLNHYKIKIGETSSLLIFGEFVHKISERDKAERYYQLLTQELPPEHLRECAEYLSFNN